MFGKPEWFHEKTSGWGLYPVAWQGWAYTVVWASVLVLPFLLLLNRSQLPEAGAWLAVSMGALIWDVKKIINTMHYEQRVAQDGVLYIGEETEHLTTKNIEMELRDRA